MSNAEFPRGTDRRLAIYITSDGQAWVVGVTDPSMIGHYLRILADELDTHLPSPPTGHVNVSYQVNLLERQP